MPPQPQTLWTRTLNPLTRDTPVVATSNWKVQHVKDQVCTKWLGPVGSAKDYPVFSKWALYGEVINTTTLCIWIKSILIPILMTIKFITINYKFVCKRDNICIQKTLITKKIQKLWSYSRVVDYCSWKSPPNHQTKLDLTMPIVDMTPYCCLFSICIFEVCNILCR